MSDHWRAVLSGEREWAIVQGDCLDVLREMPEASVDAVVTDPPYGLGFMGKAWDALPPGHEVGKLLLRVLKPGGHVLAFGGTRTYHRLACALEDAGFEIRDCLAWIYGSGFPKSLNLDGEREGWGTALKPAHEPIVLARKPLAGTVAENVEEHGTGALNVDGCRVGAHKTVTRRSPTQEGPSGWQTQGFAEATERENPAGRWPPNLLLGHGECCGDECGPCCPVAEMDRQSGEGVSRIGSPRGSETPGAGWGMTQTGAEYEDSGTAARFFPRFRYVAKASSGERSAGLDGAPRSMPRNLGVGDNAVGAGRGSLSRPRENHHPTVKPIDLLRWLCRLVTPPGGAILDPFVGSGTTFLAAQREGFRCIGIERELEYVEIARRRVEEDMPLFNRATNP